MNIRERATDILSKMTLKEKIGQLNQEAFIEDKYEEIKEKVRRGELGSLILANSATSGNDPQQKIFTDALNELERIALEESPSGIPLIYGRDAIHGHETVLPIPLALAATFDPELVYNGYRCVALEAAKDCVHWTFTPMLDISRDPRWGRCVESPGEDPYLGAKIAQAVVNGFQDENIAACAKHYIGYGAGEGGRDYYNCEITDYTLRNVYLRPFKAAVDADAATVMNSFNTLGGTCASSGSYLIKTLLKHELDFKGFVVSDWWSVAQLIKQKLAESKKDCARIAINAGVDMDMADRCFIDHLEELVKDGSVSQETIDDAVLRVLCVKLRFGLFENPFSRRKAMNYSDHDSIAENCSDEALVLLKNKNNVLPLSKNAKTVVTGPMAFEKRSLLGTWILGGDMSRVSSIAEEIKKANENAVLPSSKYLWDDCYWDIPDSDAVIVLLGESYKMTGEANSLCNIDLPREQLEYVKKLHRFGKPVIGVLCFGRPIGLEEAEPYFDAIIYAWHSGTRSAQSITKALFGDINPSGKLPMTMPRSTGQIPIYYNNAATGRITMAYYESSRAYWDRSSTPMYPFGFGLSYTKFVYSDLSPQDHALSIDEIRNGKKFVIKVKVQNAGKCGGKETSQCYIRALKSSMIRPQRELKGFVKKYYAPGEESYIQFELGFDELAFFNESSDFVVEPGKFEVFVGSDCYAKEYITINVKGTRD